MYGKGVKKQGCPRLCGLTLASHLPDADADAPRRRYPALQWQARAARRAAGRLAQAGGWLRERAVLCRYAHVPLSNLGGDSAVAVADVLMARRCGQWRQKMCKRNNRLSPVVFPCCWWQI